MYETQAIIQRITRINKDYQHVELAIEPALSEMLPGQTILVRQGKGWSPYLSEQWWPVHYSPDSLVIERPAAHVVDPGQTVTLLGPVGQPYRFRRNLRHVLLLADHTPPTALLAMIPMLLANQATVTVVLFGTATNYNTEHLSPEVEVIHGDADLNWPDRVVSVGLADQIFAVVHTDDELLRFGRIWSMLSELRAEIPRQYLFGVFRPVQPCGAGACQACMIRLTQGTTLACTEGPSIDLATVRLL